MPHGAMLQVRQALAAARYAPPWQQNLLAAALAIGGIGLLIIGDPVGIALIVCVAWFVIGRIVRHRRSHTPPGNPGDASGR